MTKIAVPRYVGQVWYESLAEIVEDFTTGENSFVNAYNGRRENRLSTYIGGVILYNTCYRDILRAGGAEALYPVLFKEAPALRAEKSALWSLEQALDGQGPIAKYDIQCLSIHDSFTVHGRVYDGLADVEKNIELYMRDRRDAYVNRFFQYTPGDVHILCNYAPYPIFDSSDFYEDRTYNNYFFKAIPFNTKDLDIIDKIPFGTNFSKAHEKLPCVDELSLLYYPSEGVTMLLVTP